MKDYEVVGWANEEGYLFCLQCESGGKRASAIFASTEFSNRQFCSSCGDELEVNVIEKGEENE